MLSLFGKWNGTTSTIYEVGGNKYYYTRVRDKDAKIVKDNANTYILLPTDDIKVIVFFVIHTQEDEKFANKVGIEYHEAIKTLIKVLVL
jgi:hypothetical protein